MSGVEGRAGAEPVDGRTDDIVLADIVLARTPIEVVVVAATDGVYVGVKDLSPQLPARRDYGRQAMTGRGLEMVDLVAARYGTETHDDGGKTVWFELGQADGAAKRTGDA